MLWFFFALLGAMTQTISDIGAKRLLAHHNIWFVAAVPYLLAGIPLLGIAILNGSGEIKIGFFSALMGTVILNILGTVLYYQAIRCSDISVTVPMLAFTPVLLILSGKIILHEQPSVSGFFGIICVVIGSILVTGMSWEKLKKIKTLSLSGPVLMLIVAVIYSISITFDKLAVQNSDPFISSSLTLTLLGIVFLLIFLFTSSRSTTDTRITLLVVLVGISVAITVVSICYAFTAAMAAYVIAIKRTSILFSVVAGGWFFNEPVFGMRIVGSVIMCFGAMILTVYQI
jgi:uncharacterized membrane protein